MKFIYKAAIAIVLVFAIVGVMQHFNLVPGAKRTASSVAEQKTMASGEILETKAVAAVAMPGTKLAAVKGQVFRWLVWEWNAQLGAFFANGGAQTTEGSLMAKKNVAVKFERQDNADKMKEEQAIFANAYAKDTNTTAGHQLVTIMGDGSAQYIAAVNETLKPLGPEYRLEVIAGIGYSRGEDGYWGPQGWKDNKDAQRGGAVAGYLKDGDWNIAIYKTANDKIPNNPDPTTWDPEAINWFAAEDYLKAVEMYVSGYCEMRPVVRNGKLTNEPKHKTCVEGVVTWTPGDMNIATKKGGLVPLLTTRENKFQMPCVIIGVRKWNIAHTGQIVDMLDAIFQGSDQVRQHPEALTRAATISANIYDDQNAAYWAKLYKGTTQKDMTGVRVPVGGSAVANLADNLQLFGLAEGSGGVENSIFAGNYKLFGDYVVHYYPKDVPSYPKVSDAVNLTFLRQLADRTTTPSEPEAATEYEVSKEPIQRENISTQRDWAIQFDTGKATFTPSAELVLQDLYNATVISALSIQVDGHTDNVGNPDSNKRLSEARAFAVRDYLMAKAPKLFPQARLLVRAFGDTQPIAPNSTDAGRAQNRRVTITLGTR